MKNNDELKDKAIEYGIEIAKSLVLALISSKFGKKNNQALQPVQVAPVETGKKGKKKKKRGSFIGKMIFAFAFKEIVVDRVQAKLNHKPSTKDYSWLFDYPAGKNLIDMQDMVNQVNPEDKVIDLGCGLGYFAIECAKKAKNGKAYCLDQDINILEKAKTSAEENAVENIEMHRAYIEKLPFSDSFFDKAFLNINIGQLSDKAKAVNEIKRVLKDSGRLYITDIISNDYYCLSSTIIDIATSSGFKAVSEKGNFLGYTLVFEK